MERNNGVRVLCGEVVDIRANIITTRANSTLSGCYPQRSATRTQQDEDAADSFESGTVTLSSRFGITGAESKCALASAATDERNVFQNIGPLTTGSVCRNEGFYASTIIFTELGSGRNRGRSATSKRWSGDCNRSSSWAESIDSSRGPAVDRCDSPNGGLGISHQLLCIPSIVYCDTLVPCPLTLF